MVQLLKHPRSCVARSRRFTRPERQGIISAFRPTLDIKVTNISLSRRLVQY
jgi:hypothetical protein